MRRQQKPNLKKLEEECSQFNALYPIGTEMNYHHVIGEAPSTRHKTRSKAQVLLGHTAVVWLEGVSGCVCLEALTKPKDF